MATKAADSRIRSSTIVVVALVALAAVLGGLALAGGGEETDEVTGLSEPATVEPLGEGSLSRLTLTSQAVDRLGIETAPVQTAGTGNSVPYSALIYQPDGSTWVYTNPSPRVYVRAAVEIDRVDGDTAFLREGPPAGTQVVTVAASELWGAEFGVGH